MRRLLEFLITQLWRWSGNDPRETLTVRFTRRQVRDLVKGLQTRRHHLKRGVKLGTAALEDVWMIEAMIHAIKVSAGEPVRRP